MTKLTEKKIGKLNYCDLLALFCLLCAAIFFILRCPLSFGYEDESFYLSIPYRLTLGDSLISDEWHVSQLSAFLLYLPVKLFVMIKGSTDGIVLFFRYLFIVVQSLVSSLVYVKLRKNGVFAVVASTVFFLHIPMYYMSLNYNSMGLIFVLLTGLFMTQNKKSIPFVYILSGIFFACAVLCNPVLLLPFVVYAVLCLIYKFTKKKEYKFFNSVEMYFECKTFLCFFLGAVITAIVFFSFLLYHSSFSELIKNLPMIFTDPEYAFSGSGQNILSLGKSIVGLFSASPVALILFFGVLVSVAFDRKRKDRKALYLFISFVAFVIYVIWILIPSGSTRFTSTENRLYMTVPLAFIGLVSYILTDKKNKPMFFFMWIFGVVYSLCLDVSSDLGSICSVLGLGVSDVASVIFVEELINEIKTEPKNLNIKQLTVSAGLLAATVVLQVCAEIYVDVDYKALCAEYLVEPKSVNFTQTVDNGPLKGLKTTESRNNIYRDTISDLSIIKKSDSKSVFIVSDRPWCYLYTEKNYASYSSYTLEWFLANAYRLPTYYAMHEDKKPQYIYISDYTNRFYAEDKENSKKILNDVEKKYDCSVIVGKAGYIVRVNNEKE